MVGANTKVFLQLNGYNYGGKADLSKTYWNLKRKMLVNTHFCRDD